TAASISAPSAVGNLEPGTQAGPDRARSVGELLGVRGAREQQQRANALGELVAERGHGVRAAQLVGAQERQRHARGTRTQRARATSIAVRMPPEASVLKPARRA